MCKFDDKNVYDDQGRLIQYEDSAFIYKVEYLVGDYTIKGEYDKRDHKLIDEGVYKGATQLSLKVDGIRAAIQYNQRQIRVMSKLQPVDEDYHCKCLNCGRVVLCGPPCCDNFLSQQMKDNPDA